MSKLNIVPDLFLGSQELNKWQKFIFDEGLIKYILENSISFGLVQKDIVDGDWSNFRIEQGTNAGTIKNADGFAIDNQGRNIRRAATDNIAIADDSLWKWIKISWQASPIEPYLVSISANGSLSAPGGSLLSILRGQPNNAVKVYFPNAVTNTGEYFVSQVINDESANLAGNFAAESNLQLVVVGAFTPDTITPLGSKYPYRYDACVMTLVNESVLNTPPTLTDGQEFLLARIKRTGSNIEIQDKRNLNIYRSKSDYELHTVSMSNNPLVGVEQITFDGVRTPRSENILQMAFGFRSSNWTINSSTNTLTLLGGNGGKFLSTADFTAGDFDAWRVYTKDGNYSIVKQSGISALQINLILDNLDPDRYTDTAQEIHVVPDVDGVEIIGKPIPGQSQITERRVLYPVNRGYVKFPLAVYNETTAQYVLTYRYKKFGVYSEETLIPDNNAALHGYLGEDNFNSAGTQIDSVLTTYVNGIITLTETPSSYANRIASVETGDLFGVQYIALDNGVPTVDLTVGTTRKEVVITNDDDLDASDADFGSLFTFTTDHFINLVSVGLTLRNGNGFWIQFRGNYDPDGNSLQIVQDFVNPGNPGIVLYTFADDDYDAALADSLIFKCYWDGTRWTVDKLGSSLADGSVTNAKIADGTIRGTKVSFDIAQNNDLDLDQEIDDLVPIPGIQVINGDNAGAPEVGNSGNVWVTITTVTNTGHIASTYNQQIAIKVVSAVGDPVGMISRRGHNGTAWTAWSNINDPAT